MMRKNVKRKELLARGIWRWGRLLKSKGLGEGEAMSWSRVAWNYGFVNRYWVVLFEWMG